MKRSYKNFGILKIISLIALLATAFLLLPSCKEAEEAAELVSFAEEHLKSNPYTVSITAATSSTDSQVKPEGATVTLTVDGQSYAFTESRGEASISYLFVDGVFYVNESFIGVITKEPITNPETIAENYEKYVTQYKNDFNLNDYEDFEIDEEDGITTVTSTAFNEEVAAKRNEELKKLVDPKTGVKTMRVDTERSAITVVFDELGRYKSIRIVDATEIIYEDGGRELLRSTYTRNYSYENSRLATPSDADKYIGMTGGYKDIFDTSFTVKTEASLTGNPDASTGAIISTGFGQNSVVKVDKNSYYYEFTSTSDTMTYKSTSTMVGNKLYFTEQANEDEPALTYITVPETDFDYWYYQNVISNYIPTLARGYNEIDVGVGSDGRTTVVCSYLSEEYFYNLYESLNYMSYSKILVPVEDGFSYTVVADESGRYLKTEFLITVKACNNDAAMSVVGTYTYKVTRTFDYTEAEEFYKDAEEGATWISAPENAKDYENITDDYYG